MTEMALIVTLNNHFTLPFLSSFVSLPSSLVVRLVDLDFRAFDTRANDTLWSESELYEAPISCSKANIFTTTFFAF